MNEPNRWVTIQEAEDMIQSAVSSAIAAHERANTRLGAALLVGGFVLEGIGRIWGMLLRPTWISYRNGTRVSSALRRA